MVALCGLHRLEAAAAIVCLVRLTSTIQRFTHDDFVVSATKRIAIPEIGAR